MGSALPFFRALTGSGCSGHGLAGCNVGTRLTNFWSYTGFVIGILFMISRFESEGSSSGSYIRRCVYAAGQPSLC